MGKVLSIQKALGFLASCSSLCGKQSLAVQEHVTVAGVVLYLYNTSPWGWWKQEDLGFKASLSYMARQCFKQNKTNMRGVLCFPVFCEAVKTAFYLHVLLFKLQL